MSVPFPLPSDELLDGAVAAVREASVPVMALFRRSKAIWDKDAGGQVVAGGERAKNPVTEADLAADRVLKESLGALLPGAAWLSEETVDDRRRLEAPWVWVVDPIDGTREYVEGIDEFAISVALVGECVPRLAVLFNPARDELYTAVNGNGAFFGGDRISAGMQASLEGARVLVSRSERRRGELSGLGTGLELVPLGSTAYKLAKLAAGAGEAYFTPRPRNEWDIAAGVLLCREAGLLVTDGQGDLHLFNQPDTLCQGVVAASPGIHSEVLALAQRDRSAPS